MPTLPPPVDELPIAPNRDMPDPEFVDASNLWVGAQPTYRVQIVALGANVYANALEVHLNTVQVAGDRVATEAARGQALSATNRVATSNSSIALTPGTKTIHTNETGRGFAADDAVVFWRRGDPETRAFGVVETSDGSDDFAVSIASGGILAPSGTGPFNDWVIADAGYFQTGASREELWALESALVAVTPKSFKDANAPVALTMGSTVTPNLKNGRRFTLACSSSFMLANPTNCSPGDVIVLDITHSAAGNVMVVGTAWKRTGGLGVLSTVSGRRDFIRGEVISVDGSGTATLVNYTVTRNPT